MSAPRKPFAAFCRRAAKAFPACSAAIGRDCAIGLLYAASACFAQTLDAPASRSHSGVSTNTVHLVRKNSTEGRKHRADASQKKTLPAAADEEEQPATVRLQNGSLTIEAHNSGLAAILKKIAQMSGMTIDGLNKNARVFGAYGPGNPREVLSNLLVGSGYNFFMAGNGRDGAPRELVLIAQSGNNLPMPAVQHQTASAPPPHAVTQQPLDENSGDQESDDPSDRDQRMQQLLQRLGKIQHQQQNSPQ